MVPYKKLLKSYTAISMLKRYQNESLDHLCVIKLNKGTQRKILRSVSCMAYFVMTRILLQLKVVEFYIPLSENFFVCQPGKLENSRQQNVASNIDTL